MHRATVTSAVALSLLALTAFPVSASTVPGAVPFADDERELRREFTVGDAAELEIEVPVGELHVEPGDGDRIDAEIEVDCSGWFADCDELEDVDLVARRDGDSLVLELVGVDDGIDGVEIDLELRVPARLGLDVDMGVGEVDIRGMERGIRVHLGVGDVRVEAREANLESVDLRVGVGEASLRPASGRTRDGSGFISRRLRWDEGSGNDRISVEIGVGDADVALR